MSAASLKILSAINQENQDQLEAMADELCKEYIAQNDTLANKNDLTALFRIGYGLYVVTSNDGKKDNGLIVNTVIQLTDTPNRVAVNINKANYSHHVIKQTGMLNVNCLSTEAPFSVFQQFGFQTGRSVDKFAGQTVHRSDNGLVFLDTQPEFLLMKEAELPLKAFSPLPVYAMFCSRNVFCSCIVKSCCANSVCFASSAVFCSNRDTYASSSSVSPSS